MKTDYFIFSYSHSMLYSELFLSLVYLRLDTVSSLAIYVQIFYFMHHIHTSTSTLQPKVKLYNAAQQQGVAHTMLI